MSEVAASVEVAPAATTGAAREPEPAAAELGSAAEPGPEPWTLAELNQAAGPFAEASFWQYLFPLPEFAAALGTIGVCWLSPLRRDGDDAGRLAQFYERLGPETRANYSVVSPVEQAAEACEAIGRYDKLRLAVRFQFEDKSGSASIVGLVELSMDLVEDDVSRFAAGGVALVAAETCRMGLCIQDALQGQGLAVHLMAAIRQVARSFRLRRVILWGGVYEQNTRAVRFYEKQGFVRVGESFLQQSGSGDDGRCIDMMLDCTWDYRLGIPVVPRG